MTAGSSSGALGSKSKGPPGANLKKEDGEENDEDETYEVAAIHGHYGSGRNIEYYVEWEGYHELTWEPRAHLEGCSVFDEYLAAQGK